MTPKPFVVLALLCCCATPPAKVTPVSHLGPTKRFASPHALAQAVERTNDGYRTLKAVHRVVIEVASDDGTRRSLSCRGVVAVKRPGSYRLVAIDALGTRLFELRYAAGKATVDVQRGLRGSDMAALVEALRSVAEDLRAIYRLEPRPAFDRRKTEKSVTSTGRTPLVELIERRGGKLARQLTIFSSSLAVARAELAGPDSSLTITYGDYERHGPLVVPRRIHVARDGRRSYWISIDVSKVMVNPELDERLFPSKS